MLNAPIPSDEEQRQQAVNDLHVLDTPTEERFDTITTNAARELGVPISTISIIDRDREWFKASSGTDQKEGPRSSSFCGHTILQGKIFVVEDTELDERFQDNPQVTGNPHVRFYAGVTLHDHKTHQPVGAFCIKDTKPRELSMTELNTLLQYAHHAEIELNKSVHGSSDPHLEEEPNIEISDSSMLNPMWRQLSQRPQFSNC